MCKVTLKFWSAPRGELIHSLGVSDTAVDLGRVVSLAELEELARERLRGMPWEFLDGASADEITARENRSAFERIRLAPRVLRDVSRLDTRVTLFGKAYEFPILLAPVGYLRVFHEAGELAAVEGANRGGATLIAANFSTTSIEEMAAASAQPLWLQLYVTPDRGLTRELAQRAEAAGCVALCVTVDFPVNSPRDRENRAGFRLPPGTERANLRSLGHEMASAPHRPHGRNIYAAVRAADATWEDVEMIRAATKLPLLLKGVLHPDDTKRALAAGVDGLIVSNHGGRTLDTFPAAIEALPRIAEAVNGRMTLLLDGGIRRGTDVCKALALGASAVCIGRPYVWGLALGGAEGVARAVEMLRTELEMAMGLLGATNLGELDRRIFW